MEFFADVWQKEHFWFVCETTENHNPLKYFEIRPSIRNESKRERKKINESDSNCYLLV